MQSDEVAHGERRLRREPGAADADPLASLHYASRVMTGTAYWV